jgi:hypothetical protein
MRGQDVRRSATGLGVSIVLLFTGALFVSPIAHAVSDQLKPIVITTSSGRGLLTSYTAGTVWPATSGPAPSLRGRAVHAGVQPGEHTSAAAFSRRWDGG